MAQSVKDNKILHYGYKGLKKFREGVVATDRAVTTTYGPKGRNVLIEKPYGRPILTRDGVTVAKEVYFKDRPKNMGAQLVVESSQTTNRLAGDGTTQTVALMAALFEQGISYALPWHQKNWRYWFRKHIDAMELRTIIDNDRELLLEELKKHTKKVTKGQLEHVATVSSGDRALGKLIAEAVEHVGQDGGIIAERAYISGVEREYIEGYYLQEGFSEFNKKELADTTVVVSAKKISSNADFLELMDKIVSITQEKPPRVAFIGEFEGQARDSIITNVMQGRMDAVIVKTPSTGDMGVHYLEDIALYCGCKLLAAGDSLKNFDSSYIGRAERVITTPYTASIFGGKHAQEDLDVRLAELKDRIETEESDHLVEKFRDRLAKLQGKIAVFRIGGTTDTEREEKEFRIEDAIQATKAAMAEGVVPGGGTTLLRLSKTEGVSDLTAKALQNVFKRLMENANLPADVKIHEVLNSEAPMGFNLRGEDKLVNLVEAGVLDPALVVQEIIKNASSNAGNALTIGCEIVFEDKKES